MKEKSVEEKLEYLIKRVCSGEPNPDTLSKDEKAYRDGYLAGIERGYGAGRREAILEMRRSGWKPRRTK